MGTAHSTASTQGMATPLPRAAETLESERLRFRHFRDSDFPVYEQWCARIEIMRYLGGKTFDRIQAWRHFAYLRGHWEFLGYGYYAVEEKATGTLIGRVGYTNQPGWPGFELGGPSSPSIRGEDTRRRPRSSCFHMPSTRSTSRACSVSSTRTMRLRDGSPRSLASVSKVKPKC